MPNPFGLELGSTPGSDVAKYMIEFKSVPRGHPDFKRYAGIWNPKKGLTSIRAFSQTFEDDTYASESREIYGRIKRQLTQAYGECSSAEGTTRHLRGDDHSDFVSEIERGDRVHASEWSLESGAALDANISHIDLRVVGIEYDKSFVALTYSLLERDFVDEDDEAAGASVL